MNLLLYSTGDSRIHDRIRWLVNNSATAAEVDAHGDPESLRARLARPLVKPAVALLVVADANDLARLLRLGPLFDDVRVILVLPEAGDDALARAALQLRPRYCAYADSDLNDLGAVLAKMFQGGQVVLPDLRLRMGNR